MTDDAHKKLGEDCARAICWAHNKCPVCGATTDQQSSSCDGWDLWITEARAVIALVVERCAEECLAECVSQQTPEDLAYNLALDHAAKAIRALSAPAPKEQDNG